ncbi:hypothetical protein D3C71_1947470 [compost metagenome]
METVRVCTPRNSDAPMSLSASSSANATPTAMAGRASGNATFRNNWARVAPSVRAASSRPAACVMNSARVVR